MARRPTTYNVWADPVAGGYHGTFQAPGLTPDVVRDENGQPRLFPNEHAAKYAASMTMFVVLNKPRVFAGKSGKPERYTKMTGPEFAVELAEAGITPTFLAYLYGTSQKRVLEWIDGVEAVPHPVRILLRLFQADSRNIDLAEEVTDAVTTERKPRRDDSG